MSRSANPGEDVSAIISVVQDPHLPHLVVMVGMLTLLVTVIEIRWKCKGIRYLALFNGGVLGYFIIRSFGHVVSTVLALVSMKATWISSSDLTVAHMAVATVAGVFAFDGILRNTNVSFGGSKVLPIGELITKAMADAVETTMERQEVLTNRLIASLAKRYKNVSDENINMWLDRIKGDGYAHKVDVDAAKHGHGAKYKKLVIFIESDLKKAREYLRPYQ
jgi:hypothetical protein